MGKCSACASTVAEDFAKSYNGEHEEQQIVSKRGKKLPSVSGGAGRTAW